MAHETLTAAPAVPIAQSELRRLPSSVVGQEYLIKVWLPETYATGSRSYPVLYLLDGDHAFAMATDIVQYLIYGEHVPELIIVSPAYGSKDPPNGGGTNMRNRDLVPFPMDWSDLPVGGAQYLQFLQHELMPYVETIYRIDNTDRTIWGYSLGSGFVLYSLFQQPDLFHRYIAVDGFDDRIFALEAAYAAQHTTLPVKLSLSSAGDVSKFVDTLRGRNYRGLDLSYTQLPDIGHFAVGAEGLTKGLVAVFQS